MLASRQPLRIALETNSGPLSLRRYRGAPWTLTSLESTSMTRLERMLPATSIAKHSRVYSSMTVRHFNCWPLAQASKTKSYAHRYPAPVAGNGRGRPVAILAPRPFSRHLQAMQAPQPMSSIGAHRVSTTLQEDLDAPITVARILSRQLPHHAHRGRVALDQAGLITQCRSSNGHQRARSSDRYAPSVGVSNLAPTRRRAYHLWDGPPRTLGVL